MKKIFAAAAVVAAVFSMSSCVTPSSTNYRVADSKYVTSSVAISSINAANLKVSEQRETFIYTVTSKDKNGLSDYGKTNATYDFLEKFGADIIVEPRYERTQTGDVVTWKITGRPAWLANFNAQQ